MRKIRDFNSPEGREYWESCFIPEPNSGCFLWLKCLNQQGYGQIRTGGDPGIAFLAHRFSWVLSRGSIPDGLQVLHKCDTPACVNPDHLFLGTAADNMMDMSRKGRWGVRNLPRGERHHRATAKLTDSDVRIIRDDPRSQREIAKSFGVTSGVISRIKTGTSYQHVT